MPCIIFCQIGQEKNLRKERGRFDDRRAEGRYGDPMRDMMTAKSELTEQTSLENRQRLRAALLADTDGILTSARLRLSRLAALRGVAPDAIDDVVQETLLEAWKHLDRLQSLAGFQPWVDEICRNVCHRYTHRQQSQVQRFAPLLVPYQLEGDQDGEAEAPLLNIPDPHTLDLSEALSRQDLSALLNRALGTLSGSAREVIELCYLAEIPQREAALRLGLSISALEARLHRARKQLRQMLSGPLRVEAEGFGLALEQAHPAGLRETRIWCNICGRQRLQGVFLPQPDGGMNLHLDCPGCFQRYGVHNVHSKGLVDLKGLHSFRPAWKRTMQEATRQAREALAQGRYACMQCGAPVLFRVWGRDEGVGLPPGPLQFWLGWHCPRCGEGISSVKAIITADDVVYWSDPRTRRFMLEHPRWITLPDRAVEHAGQAAIHFRLEDVTSTERLNILAHRQTLEILSIF